MPLLVLGWVFVNSITGVYGLSPSAYSLLVDNRAKKNIRAIKPSRLSRVQFNSEVKQSYGSYRTIVLPKNQNLTGEFYSKAHSLLSAIESKIPFATSLKFKEADLSLEQVNLARRTKFKAYIVAASDENIRSLLEGYVLPRYIEAARNRNSVFRVTNRIGKVKQNNPSAPHGAASSESYQELQIPDLETYQGMSQIRKQIILTALLMRELQGLESNEKIDYLLANHSTMPSHKAFAEEMGKLSEKGFSQIANNLGALNCFSEDPLSPVLRETIEGYGKASFFNAESLFDIQGLSLSDLFEIAELFDYELETKSIAKKLSDHKLLLTQSSIDVTEDLKTRCKIKGQGISETLVIQGLNLTPLESDQVYRVRKDNSSSKARRSTATTFSITPTAFVTKLSPEEYELLQQAIKIFDSLKSLDVPKQSKALWPFKLDLIIQNLNRGNFKSISSSVAELQGLIQSPAVKENLQSGLNKLKEFARLRKQHKASKTTQEDTPQVPEETDANLVDATEVEPPVSEIEEVQILLTQGLNRALLNPVNDEEKEASLRFFGRFSSPELGSFVAFLRGEITNENIDSHKFALFMEGLANSQTRSGSFNLEQFAASLDEGQRQLLFNAVEEVVNARIAKQERQAQKAAAKVKADTTVPSSIQINFRKTKKAKAKPITVITPSHTVVTSPCNPEAANISLINRPVYYELIWSRIQKPALTLSSVRLINSIVSPVLTFANYNEYRNSNEYLSLENQRGSNLSLPVIEIDGKNFFKLTEEKIQEEIAKETAAKAAENTKENTTQEIVEETTEKTIEKTEEKAEELSEAQIAGLAKVSKISDGFKSLYGHEPLDRTQYLIPDNRVDSLINWVTHARSFEASKGILIDAILFLNDENNKLVSSQESLVFQGDWIPEKKLKNSVKGLSDHELQTLKTTDLNEDSLKQLNERQLKAILYGMEYTLNLVKLHKKVKDDFTKIFALESVKSPEGAALRKQLYPGYAAELESHSIHPQIVKIITLLKVEDVLKLAYDSLRIPYIDQDNLLLLPYDYQGGEMNVVAPGEELEVDPQKLSSGYPLTLIQLLQIIKEKVLPSLKVSDLPVESIVPDMKNEDLLLFMGLGRKEMQAIKNFYTNTLDATQAAKAGRTQEEYNFYKEALRIDPPPIMGLIIDNYSVAYQRMAELCTSRGEYENAIKYAEKYLELVEKPSDKTYQILCSALAFSKQYEKLDQLLNFLEAKDPGFKDSNIYKLFYGLVLVHQKQFDQAYQLLSNITLNDNITLRSPEFDYVLAFCKHTIMVLIESRVYNQTEPHSMNSFSNLFHKYKNYAQMAVGKVVLYLIAADFFDKPLAKGETIFTIPATMSAKSVDVKYLSM